MLNVMKKILFIGHYCHTSSFRTHWNHRNAFQLPSTITIGTISV